jgi:hypothetical protein
MNVTARAPAMAVGHAGGSAASPATALARLHAAAGCGGGERVPPQPPQGAALRTVESSVVALATATTSAAARLASKRLAGEATDPPACPTAIVHAGSRAFVKTPH